MKKSIMIERIMQCHRVLWHYRYVLEDIWPTPSPKHCAMFAITEVGEVFNAKLLEYSEYKRNSERDHQFKYELADTLMMVLSCTRTIDIDAMKRPLCDEHDLTDKALDLLPVQVSMIYSNIVFYGNDDVNSIPSFKRSLICLMSLLGDDALMLMEERLERIWMKRLEEIGGPGNVCDCECGKLWNRTRTCECGRTLIY